MTYMLPSTWLCTKWNSANFHFITANLPLWYFDYSYPRNYKHFHFTALWVSCNHCALYLTCGIPDRLGSLQGNKTTGLQSFLNYHLWSIGAENFQKTQKACLSILNGGSYPISKVFRTNFCVIVINQEPILKIWKTKMPGNKGLVSENFVKILGKQSFLWERGMITRLQVLWR